MVAQGIPFLLSQRTTRSTHNSYEMYCYWILETPKGSEIYIKKQGRQGHTKRCFLSHFRDLDFV